MFQIIEQNDDLFLLLFVNGSTENVYMTWKQTYRLQTLTEEILQ